MTEKTANQSKQKKLVSAAQVFGQSLKTIDEFVTSVDATNNIRKRGRDAAADNANATASSDADVSSALQQLTSIVAQHRLAAAPSIEQLSKRLTLLLCSSDSAENDEAWQCAELCCCLYGAGMSRMMHQLLEHLILNKPSSPNLSRTKMERLGSMLRAVGQYVQSSLLQQFSQRAASWTDVDGSSEYIALAEALLCVCSPTSTPLFVRCVELIERSWGTTSDLQHLRALHRLKTTLGLLRHPSAVPFFIPPAEAVEAPLPLYQRESAAVQPKLHQHQNTTTAATSHTSWESAKPQIAVTVAAAGSQPPIELTTARDSGKHVAAAAAAPARSTAAVHEVTFDSARKPATPKQGPATPKQHQPVNTPKQPQHKAKSSAAAMPDIVID